MNKVYQVKSVSKEKGDKAITLSDRQGGTIEAIIGPGDWKRVSKLYEERFPTAVIRLKGTTKYLRVIPVNFGDFRFEGDGMEFVLTNNQVRELL